MALIMGNVAPAASIGPVGCVEATGGFGWVRDKDGGTSRHVKGGILARKKKINRLPYGALYGAQTLAMHLLAAFLPPMPPMGGN